MNNNFDILAFISQLVYFSPRQGKNEQQTAKFITSFLGSKNVVYALHTFRAKIPLFTKEELVADGKYVLLT